MTFRKLVRLAVVIEALPFVLFFALLTGAADELVRGSQKAVRSALKRMPNRA